MYFIDYFVSIALSAQIRQDFELCVFIGRSFSVHISACLAAAAFFQSNEQNTADFKPQ